MSQNCKSDLWTARRAKSLVAAVLGFLWPGWGHFYVGYPVRGLLLIGSVALAPFFFDLARLALGPGPWILRLNYIESTTRLLFCAIGALGPMRLARNPSNRLRPSGLTTILIMLIYTALSGLLHDFLWWNRKSLERHSPVPRSFLMRGSDMEPSVNYCDEYLANVWSKHPVHREIVAFQPDPDYRGEQEQKVARVAGLPGDTVQIHNGKMTRNGSNVDEP